MFFKPKKDYLIIWSSSQLNAKMGIDVKRKVVRTHSMYKACRKVERSEYSFYLISVEEIY